MHQLSANNEQDNEKDAGVYRMKQRKIYFSVCSVWDAIG
ncbi:hypothetical protein CSC14_3488 [Proteus mirabilis]|nr:hypothetical protein CSC14_3488 [Proteus mirabilis]